MKFDDLEHWLRGSALEVLLIAMGAVLLSRFLRWAINVFLLRKEFKAAAEGIAPPPESKHKRVLAQVLDWSAVAVTYFIAAILALPRFGIPLTSVVAPATVLGAALGFGSQSMVKDLLTGFFIFAERQYGYGDVIRISEPGTEEGISGTVEEVTLRTTKIRTVSGELVILPNGEIRQVTNMSRDWAQVVIDVPLPVDADITVANELLELTGNEMYADPKWQNRLLTTPEVKGIESLAVGFIQVRFVAQTPADDQWDVGRELRGRIAKSLRKAGIVVQPLVSNAQERPS